MAENNAMIEIIGKAIQIPGIKVDRDAFLREQFKNDDADQIASVISVGPVNAGKNREELRKMAEKLITDTTLKSTGASFLAGLPGGIAMAATIPADVLQFYAMALRLAQQIAYLYNEPDLWNGDQLDDQKIINQLILYCGVMLGATGAAQAIRVMASSLASKALKKIPQKALTKTFYYPIIKSIAKVFGKTMTKSTFSKGVAKAVPILGGIVSGGITYASFRPMGERLLKALEEAHFSYSETDFKADLKVIMDECAKYDSEQKKEEPVESEFAAEPEYEEKMTEEQSVAGSVEEPPHEQNILEQIAQAKKLFESGVLSEEEFTAIKAKLIARL